MITEDYVSFETAKLLKEKGFESDDCHTAYDENGDFFWYGDYSKDRKGIVNAPTIQMAMKWLREIQGLSIYASAVWKDVEVQYGDWEPVVVAYNWFMESLLDNTYSKMSVEPFLTYEEACESAIRYCLENLI